MTCSVNIRNLLRVLVAGLTVASILMQVTDADARRRRRRGYGKFKLESTTTGRSRKRSLGRICDGCWTPRERVVARTPRDPMEDPGASQAYPAALVKLMRAATAREWRDRPMPLEFGSAFNALL